MLAWYAAPEGYARNPASVYEFFVSWVAALAERPAREPRFWPSKVSTAIAQVLSPQYNSNLSRTNDIFNHSNLHFWQCASRHLCHDHPRSDAISIPLVCCRRLVLSAAALS